jgi:hypothetical protein
MTQTQLSQVFTGIAGIAHALDDAGVQAFKTTVSQLVAELQPVLPTKLDGTQYSDDEIHAAAVAARVPFQAVLDRDSGDPNPPPVTGVLDDGA